MASRYDEQVHAYVARRRKDALAPRARGRILEIGCGSGRITEGLTPRGVVIAVDISLEMARILKAKLTASIVADGEKLPFPDEMFDSVVSSEVLYYLDDPRAMMSEAFRVVRRGGCVAISSINQRWFVLDRLRRWLGRVGLPVGSCDDCYSKVFHRSELIDLFERAGFERITAKGILFFPSARLDRINTALEQTLAERFALAHVVWGTKT
jgi:ubiquinone/menaquinone biosynthesis C-methylase UbiE